MDITGHTDGENAIARVGALVRRIVVAAQMQLFTFGSIALNLAQEINLNGHATTGGKSIPPAAGLNSPNPQFVGNLAITQPISRQQDNSGLSYGPDVQRFQSRPGVQVRSVAHRFDQDRYPTYRFFISIVVIEPIYRCSWRILY